MDTSCRDPARQHVPRVQGWCAEATWTSSLALAVKYRSTCSTSASGTLQLFCRLHGGVRISKGIARWTANFTPPSKAYGPDSLPPPATKLSVSAPGSATSGTAFNVTVTALDANNNRVPTYTGTVHLTSNKWYGDAPRQQHADQRPRRVLGDAQDRDVDCDRDRHRDRHDHRHVREYRRGGTGSEGGGAWLKSDMDRACGLEQRQQLHLLHRRRRWWRRLALAAGGGGGGYAITYNIGLTPNSGVGVAVGGGGAGGGRLSNGGAGGTTSFAGIVVATGGGGGGVLAVTALAALAAALLPGMAVMLAALAGHRRWRR